MQKQNIDNVINNLEQLTVETDTELIKQYESSMRQILFVVPNIYRRVEALERAGLWAWIKGLPWHDNIVPGLIIFVMSLVLGGFLAVFLGIGK